jgi:Holliday junction DNA helicase RuvA
VIASLNGTVKSTSLNFAVIEVGGVGLQVFLSPRYATSLVVGTFVSLHTTLLVREDALTLFGFETAADKDLFELLQTVTGIGPKVAQSALSVYDAPELVHAIAVGELALLERIPGLGKKGAARLVLELRDKVSDLATTSPKRGAASPWRLQIEGALTNLGFTQRESNEALDQIAMEISEGLDSVDIPNLLRRALQIRGNS